MRDNEFRRALDECLERIRQGDTVEACLAAHPEQAAQLAPFLNSAAIMRKLQPPQPSAEAIATARNRLLARVVEGSGKEAVMRGMFKFSHAVMAVAAVFVMSLGLVAAAGSGILDGGSNTVTFNARAIVTDANLSFVQREDDHSYVYLLFNSGTRFEDASGAPITWAGIGRESRIFVEATPPTSGRFFGAQLVRLIAAGATPTPAPTPEPTPVPNTEAPKPEPTPAPTEAPKPEPPKPEPTVKVTEKPVPPKDVVEFWATVTEVAPDHLTANKENVTPVTVWTNGETAYPNGQPFVGVKVWVLAYVNGDGTFTAKRVTNKLAEFSGVVKAADGCAAFIVQTNGAQKTVRANEQTSFPQGCPVAGDKVGVFAYYMGDGSYLAKEISILPDGPSVFEGVVIKNLTAEWTLKVQVGAEYKIVCYEFASNAADIQAMGDSIVGKTVRVHVDNFDGSTYFAGLVEVLN